MTTKTTFWEEYLKRIDKNALPKTTLQEFEKILLLSKNQLEEAIGIFRKELTKVPIGAEITNWLQRLDLPLEITHTYETSMLHLIDAKLLKITNEKGQLRTLNDLSFSEHQKIIEAIRCLPKFSIAEKEKMVETYILFSQHLSNLTCGLITQGEDPDFQSTIKKVVLYNEFIKFVQFLPQRDALIAKLLYFGAPTMDEVLSLRAEQIDLRKEMVKFKKFSVRYPKHVMQELKSYLAQKKKEDLLFVNLRNEQIERTHLNNCFNRASRKLSNIKRITPKMLLESDIAKSIASINPIFSRFTV